MATDPRADRGQQPRVESDSPGAGAFVRCPYRGGLEQPSLGGFRPRAASREEGKKGDC